MSEERQEEIPMGMLNEDEDNMDSSYHEEYESAYNTPRSELMSQLICVLVLCVMAIVLVVAAAYMLYNKASLCSCIISDQLPMEQQTENPELLPALQDSCSEDGRDN